MNQQAKLSDRIVQDLVGHLATGRDLPFRLNVLGIARHYGISRTPVREAVRELERMGMLAVLPNGKLGKVASETRTPALMPAPNHAPVSIASSAGDTQLAFAAGDTFADGGAVGDGDADGDTQVALADSVGDSVGDTQLATGSSIDGDGPSVRTEMLGAEHDIILIEHADAADHCNSVSVPKHVKHVPKHGVSVPSQLTPSQLPPKRQANRLESLRTASAPVALDSASSASSTWGRIDWRVEVRRNLAHIIVRLSLRGQTSFLREQSWSRRLGIGRGVLRQILSELAGQGFVDHVPRRGWQVRPFDSEAMLQYLEIREVLELHALELAKDRLNPASLQEMLAGNPAHESRSTPEASRPRIAIIESFSSEKHINTGDNLVCADVPVPTAVPVPAAGPVNVPVPAATPTAANVPVPQKVTETLNNEIHGYLIALSNNRYILDFFERHSTYYDQLFEMATVETGWRDAMAQQHREILTALLSKDWSGGKQALRNHIRAQRPVVQTLLSKVRDESH
ncbi:MAG: FCD domain-containing protein [Planctomycetaceae bacterium]|nr:FCD domain-containing protein [Planctomycetaceae bacterium]